MESQQQRERFVYELFVVYLCCEVGRVRESKEEEPIGSQVDGGGGISHPDKIVGHVRLLQHAQSGNDAREKGR